MKVDDKDIEQAWKDLARHPQWPVARLKLVRLLLAGVPRGLDDRALREEVGRQSLARHLLDVTDSASEENHDRTDERAVFARPDPVTSSRRGARRRTAVFDA